MPIKILMPALSPTMEHGNLAKWIKKEGDKVSAGEVIAEIETDKATMEVEAVEEGVLAKIIVAEGAQEIPVNALIAVLLEEGEAAESLEAFIQQSAEPAAAAKAKSEPKIEKLVPAPAVVDKPASIAVSTASNKNTRIFASPLAKRVAAMEGVSLASLTGTGPHGRIIKADVFAGGGQIKAKGVVTRNSEEYKTVPNNNMRKIIAKRLLESKLTVPHFYLSIECMMDSVLAARVELNTSFGEDKSKKLSVNDFVIMAAAKALKDVPEANASWSDEAIMLYNNVDISIAVAIDGGLITPVIRNADQKAITVISSEMKDLAKRARENALKPEEFQGGGFSISNLGMYGVKNFNAIITPPHGCIIAGGMSSKRAVIVDDKIEMRTMMDVNLSCDHRVVDGAVGATFLASFKKYMESPILMFI
jgi:pyruvate dehydrogenase E2 component (dihydrolipoamide acetyltransferase)